MGVVLGLRLIAEKRTQFIPLDVGVKDFLLIPALTIQCVAKLLNQDQQLRLLHFFTSLSRNGLPISISKVRLIAVMANFFSGLNQRYRGFGTESEQ